MFKKIFLSLFFLFLVRMDFARNAKSAEGFTLILEEPTFDVYSAFCKTDDAQQISKSVRTYCEKYDIPILVAYALIETESGGCIGGQLGFYKSDAKSSADCWGLTQVSKYALQEFNEYTGKKYKISEMTDIDKNIEVGLWYFSFLKEKLKLDNWEHTYIAYNVGGTEYGKKSKYEFYDEKGVKKGPYYNSWFYKRGFFPPKENGQKLTKMKKYKPGARFQYFENQYETQFHTLYWEVALR